MRHLLSTAITALILAGAVLPALAAKPNANHIRFRPTLLSETTTLAQPIAVVPAESDALPTIAVETHGEATDTLRYSQAITQLEAQGDRYGLALREPLLSRANQYLQSGNPQAALNDLDRAMQITRIQEGLNSIEQAAILRTMIKTYVGIDDMSNAHRLQEALLNLQAQHYGRDSVEYVPALLEWADWNVSLYLSGQLPDESTAIMTAPDGSPLERPNPYMQEAHKRYVAALEILHQHSDASDANLLVIERKLAAVNFMVDKEMMEALGGEQKNAGDEFDVHFDRIADRVRHLHYVNGDSALKRALTYGYLMPEPDQDYIAARMLELADWNLLFGHRTTALELYQQAQQVLADANLPQQEIDRFYAAGLPVETPDATYQPAPAPEAFTGYIDVELKLSKFGLASDTRLLTDENADPAVVDALMRTISNAKFRPLFEQGSPASNGSVKLRYFYTSL